jgi:MFS family permease
VSGGLNLRAMFGIGPPTARRQLLAVGACFFVTGATFGTFAARVPAVQDRLHLAADQLSVVFAGLMVGAFVGIACAGAVVGRVGSRRMLPGALVAFGAALASIPFAGPPVLVGTMTAFGFANSFVDVAINTQGTHVERVFRRPILSGLHAMFSVGALAAAGGGALLARADTSIAIHFPIMAALPVALALAVRSTTTDEPRERAPAARLALPTGATLLPGLIAFCMVFADDVANTWSTVYVREVARADAAVAAATFALYAGGMLVGRLIADGLVARIGAGMVLRLGAAVAAAGAAFAIAVPTTFGALAGFILLGFGLAPVLPVVYGVVGNKAPERAGTVIATVTAMGYLGSVAGPPIVGALSSPLGLRAAFLVLPIVAASIGLLALKR